MTDKFAVSVCSDQNALKPEDICPFCLDELRRGVPENGICGHEQLLADNPHLRFNAPPTPPE